MATKMQKRWEQMRADMYEQRREADMKLRNLIYHRKLDERWRRMKDKVTERPGRSGHCQYWEPADGRQVMLRMQAQQGAEVVRFREKLREMLAWTDWFSDDFNVAHEMWTGIQQMTENMIYHFDQYLSYRDPDYTMAMMKQDFKRLCTILKEHQGVMVKARELTEDRFIQLLKYIIFRQRGPGGSFGNALHVMSDGSFLIAEFYKAECFQQLRRTAASASRDVDKAPFDVICRLCVGFYVLSMYVGISHCSLGACHAVQFRAAVHLLRFLLAVHEQRGDLLAPDIVLEVVAACRAGVAKLRSMHGPRPAYPHEDSCQCPMSDADRKLLRRARGEMETMFIELLTVVVPKMRRLAAAEEGGRAGTAKLQEKSKRQATTIVAAASDTGAARFGFALARLEHQLGAAEAAAIAAAAAAADTTATGLDKPGETPSHAESITTPSLAEPHRMPGNDRTVQTPDGDKTGKKVGDDKEGKQSGEDKAGKKSGEDKTGKKPGEHKTGKTAGVDKTEKEQGQDKKAKQRKTNSTKPKKMHLWEHENELYATLKGVIVGKWVNDESICSHLHKLMPILDKLRLERIASIPGKQKLLADFKEPYNAELLNWSWHGALRQTVQAGFGHRQPRMSNGMTIEGMVVRVNADSACGRSSLLWESLPEESERFDNLSQIDRVWGMYVGEKLNMKTYKPGKKRYLQWEEGKVHLTWRVGDRSVDDDALRAQEERRRNRKEKAEAAGKSPKNANKSNNVAAAAAAAAAARPAGVTPVADAFKPQENAGVSKTQHAEGLEENCTDRHDKQAHAERPEERARNETEKDEHVVENETQPCDGESAPGLHGEETSAEEASITGGDAEKQELIQRNAAPESERRIRHTKQGESQTPQLENDRSVIENFSVGVDDDGQETDSNVQVQQGNEDEAKAQAGRSVTDNSGDSQEASDDNEDLDSAKDAATTGGDHEEHVEIGEADDKRLLGGKRGTSWRKSLTRYNVSFTSKNTK